MLHVGGLCKFRVNTCASSINAVAVPGGVVEITEAVPKALVLAEVEGVHEKMTAVEIAKEAYFSRHDLLFGAQI